MQTLTVSHSKVYGPGLHITYNTIAYPHTEKVTAGLTMQGFIQQQSVELGEVQ